VHFIAINIVIIAMTLAELLSAAVALEDYCFVRVIVGKDGRY
jgi:hypothetical protein